ncbi:MAG: exodeoxyribonuclease III [Planctomycetaceae bacterium]
MRITTWNVNGLRAALRKGFAEHLARINPDVLLLQEVRVLPEQLDAEWRQPEGWHVVWHPAQRKGYAGTAIWSRFPFESVQTGISRSERDHEGRLLTVQIGELSISSVYLPSGSSGDERQAVKDEWMVRFRRWVDRQRKRGPVVFGGDLNVAHTEQDIFYAKSNARTSGFLPHERSWFGDLLESGWHDMVREHFGDVQGPYSWWSNRGKARELDRGWRIDYLLANAEARSRFRTASIDRDAGITVSDHAPVTVDLD